MITAIVLSSWWGEAWRLFWQTYEYVIVGAEG